MKKAKNEIDPIYARLKELRKSRNYSQKEIALELGMEQGGYSQLEAGKTKLTVEILRKIAEIWKVPMESFFHNNTQANVDKNYELLIELIQTNAENAIQIPLKNLTPDYPETNDMQRRIIAIQDENIREKAKIIGMYEKEISGLYLLIEEIYATQAAKKTMKPSLIKKIQLTIKNQFKPAANSTLSSLRF